MKKYTYKSRLLVKGFLLAVTFIFSQTVVAAVRDSVTLTETQTDKTKCVTVNDGVIAPRGTTICFQITTGSYTLIAKISENTFFNNNIFFETVTENTPLTVTVGRFSFTRTLADDPKYKYTPRLVKAIWTPDTREVCIKLDKANGECTKFKTLTDTTVSINGDPSKSITLTIKGVSNAQEESGQKMFTDLCIETGNKGIAESHASIGVGDSSITATLIVNCKSVKKQTVTPNKKFNGSFDLINLSLSAKLK